MEDNAIGAALTQSQVSRYDPRTNRCYVELTAQNIQDPNRYMNTALYDGQTKELLAFIKIDKGQKAGMVFDRLHTTINLTNAGWDDAKQYIDQMMAEDRK